MSVRIQRVERAIIPDEYGDASWLYQDDLGFEDRREAYERGEFGLIGVKAIAEILVPHGTDYIIQRIESPGLWGIESDSDESYLDSVYEEERVILFDMLHELGIDTAKAIL